MTWWGWLIVAVVALYALCVTAAFAALLLGFRALVAGAGDRARAVRERRHADDATALFDRADLVEIGKLNEARRRVARRAGALGVPWPPR